MLQQLQIDCQGERERIVGFIQQTLRAANHSRIVLNLSGGLDSALVAALCADAVSPENVHALLLPYRTSTPESARDALAQAEALGISYEQFEITPLVDAFVAREPDISAQRKGNIMARSRMIALFDRAAARGALAAGTSNRTERLLGYFTMHGDAAASFQPIIHLYKCQVSSLARHLGVLPSIITKAPSADLWQGQTDEGELGFTYAEADAVLYLLTERGLGEEEIAAQGFAPEVVRAIVRRMQTTEFKRRPVPEMPVDGRRHLA